VTETPQIRSLDAADESRALEFGRVERTAVLDQTVQSLLNRFTLAGHEIIRGNV
jgi:hypothetical protein